MADTYGIKLPDVQDVSRVIEAPAESAGLATGLQTLAKSLGSISNIFEDRARDRQRQAAAQRQAAQDARQLEQDRDQAEGKSVANDVTIGVSLVNAGGLSDSFQSEEEVPGLAQSSDPRIQNDVAKAAKQVSNTSVAVEQGKLPEVSKQAQIDLLFNRLLVKYPDRAHEIAAQFKSLGVDSALFDELKGEVDEASANKKAGREFNIKMLDLGKADLPPEVAAGMTEQQIIAHGLEMTRVDRQQELLQKRAQLVATQTSTDIAQHNFTREQIADQMSVAVDDQIMTALTPTVNAMNKLLLTLGEPGQKVEDDVRYGNLLNLARMKANNTINNIISRGSFNNAAEADAARQRLTKRFEEMVMQPYEQRNKGFAAAAQAFETHMGLSNKIAAPVINDLRKFGISASDIPEVMAALSPALKQQAAKEFANIGRPGFNQNLATLRLTNILNVFKGEKNLTSIDTPAERQEVVAASYNYVIQNGKAVAAGTGNPDTYLNTSRQLIVASEGLSPQTPITTLTHLSSALFNDNAINAMNKLMADPKFKEEASINAQGARAAAATALSAAKQAIRGQNFDPKTSPWRVVVDGDGNYRAIENPKWRGTTTTNNYGGDFSTGQTTTTPRPPLPASVRALVEVANRTNIYLTRTGAWDADAPKGTPKQVKRFWALGEPTPDMRKEQQAARAKGDFNSMANAVEKDLLKAADLEAPSGDNRDILGPEGTGKNPRSSAVGPGQFTEDTWVTTLSRHAPDAIKGLSRKEILNLRTSNPDLAREATGWLRSDNGNALKEAGIAPTKQNTALAHFAGSGGAIALLTANPSTPVEQVLGTKVVAANPHLKGKTVAETIAWAKGFYRG